MARGTVYEAGFPLAGGIFRAQRKAYCFFIEFRQKRTLETSENQSYCSLCVPHDQNNSRSVRMISSSGKPA